MGHSMVDFWLMVVAELFTATLQHIRTLSVCVRYLISSQHSYSLQFTVTVRNHLTYTSMPIKVAPFSMIHRRKPHASR